MPAGPAFMHYDPSYMLGREVHRRTLGIFGMGRIGEQVAKRARAFDMNVLYHNRNRRPDVEQRLGVRIVRRDELLAMRGLRHADGAIDRPRRVA